MMDAALRTKIETTIDRLVAVLDAIDATGEDREPSLGWPESGSGCQSFANMGNPHDYEEVCEDEGAQCDDEGDIWSDNG